MKTLILSLALLLTQVVQAAPSLDDDYYQANTIRHVQQLKDSKTFLALGDWGRNGHFYQRDVAKWMDIAVYQLDADFIVTTGDNFYDNGIASVDDPYWQTSFEDVYYQPHLFVDWYATLGNHDYRGNWQAQIDYTNVSRRWNMPAPYYTKYVDLNEHKQLLLVFLDTSPLNPDYDQEPKYARARAQGQQAQLDWLEDVLKNQTAQWVVVIGHHPLYSSGKRYGKNTAIRKVLEPVLEKYKVDAYIAGHEHDLQHNQAADKSVAHFVSGGGSEIRPVGHYDFTRFAQSAAGFASVSANSTTLLIQFIDSKGDTVYHYQMQKAR